MTDLHPKGVNHLALSTKDMKNQVKFWSEVLGCPLKALYWMHGVPDTFHGFIELNPDSYIAFVQHPKNSDEIELGKTHAGNASGPSAIGTMQHVALHVDTFDELMTMRDRIRSHGVQVMGPLDHGFIQSIYFAGPEGLSLEIATGSDIPAENWIDPEVTDLCGMSLQEVDAYKNPVAHTPADEPVPQPDRTRWTDAIFLPEKYHDAVMRIPDQEAWDRFSETEPPVQ